MTESLTRPDTRLSTEKFNRGVPRAEVAEVEPFNPWAAAEQARWEAFLAEKEAARHSATLRAEIAARRSRERAEGMARADAAYEIEQDEQAIELLCYSVSCLAHMAGDE